jgi:hypothetical protein
VSERSVTGVVLGVADSLTGRAALQVAVDIAAQGQLTLDLVRVQVGDGPSTDDIGADNTVGRLWTAARERAPQLAITSEVVRGELDSTLVDRSARAALLVLGAGSDANEDMRWLLAHTLCPVIVVDAAEHIVDYRAGADLTARAVQA